MKSHKRAFESCLAFIFALAFSSCSNNDPGTVALTPITYKNLNADYAAIELTPAGLETRPKQTNRFTFFSFMIGAVVPRADSATSRWDIGFRGTTIIVNGGSTGKWQGMAQVVDGNFDELGAAPEEGYIADAQTNNRRPVAAAYAIQDETGKGWYSEDKITRLITPLPEKVIVIRTADGRYAKMQILSYYQDAPNLPSISSKDRYYTFRYIYQPGNSTTLK